METRQITVPLYGKDAILHCYQYDTGVYIKVANVKNQTLQMNFSISGSNETIVVNGQRSTESGIVYCKFNVPTVMLAQSNDVIGYMFATQNNESITAGKVCIKIEPRPKPTDWSETVLSQMFIIGQNIRY